jgi:transaldolase
MKDDYFHRVSAQTPTKFWINNVTREEAQLAIDAGAVGCTQNPSYTWKMLTHSEESGYAIKILDGILASEKDDNVALIKLQRELVKKIAEVFLPIYRSTRGKFGYVSIQGDPFMEDTETIIKYARFNREAGPNIMAKIPATAEGIKAIKVLAAEGIPINATEIMAIRQAIDVCDTHKSATDGMAQMPLLCYSHIAGIFDEYLEKYVASNQVEISHDVLWQAGICVAKKLYEIIKERGYQAHYIGGGARGLQHFTEMVGADASITINWKGTADKLIETNPVVIQQFLRPTPQSVIDELIEKLVDFKRAYLINEITEEEYEDFGPVVLFRNSFESAWTNAKEFIANRRKEIG